MKVDSIYRLESRIDFNDRITINDKFYTSKEEALQQLEDLKSEIEEAYADCDCIEYGTCIALQEIKLIDIEDIDIYAKEIPLSKWVCDEKATEEQWADMRKDGKDVDKSMQIGMWKNYNADLVGWYL